jgi:hypothetical protein
MPIQTYILETGSTWKGSAITDATDFSFSESSSPTRLSTDGSRSVGLIVVDQKVATITLNGINQDTLSGANFKIGSSGSLVLKGKLRGAGSTTSTVKTFTFAETVLVSTSASTPNETNGSVSLNFESYDSNDDASIVAFS